MAISLEQPDQQFRRETPPPCVRMAEGFLTQGWVKGIIKEYLIIPLNQPRCDKLLAVSC